MEARPPADLFFAVKGDRLLDQLTRTLHDVFGHDQFRPLQRETVEAVMGGRSVLAVFATGGGKSLCYQMAGHLLPGVTLVFSPLISLMKDQSETTLAHRIGLTTINGHTPPEDAAERLQGLHEGRYRILLVSPERLRQASFVRAIRDLTVSLLVVDEAHCVSEWGHDFRPDYRLIRSFREAVGKPPVMAMTATATPQVRRDIKAQLGIPDAVEIVGTADRPNLSIAVHRLASDGTKQQEVTLAVGAALDSGSSAIVYVPTTREAERLAEQLSQTLRKQVAAYHGKQPPFVRTRVQEAFMSGEAPVVVATNAFGMGLDKPDVRLVLHAGVPASLESYYQEIGRAGRDGLPARAVLLYTNKDVEFREWLLGLGRTGTDEVRHVLSDLQQGKPLFPDRPERRPQPPARKARPGSTIRVRRPAREVELPKPRDEAETTRLRAILTELELQGVVKRHGQGPNAFRLAVTDDAGLEEAVLRAGTLLDRLYRRRLAKLKAVQGFLASPGCRREYLLRYFGEKVKQRPVPCCDRCQRVEEPVLVGGRPRFRAAHSGVPAPAADGQGVAGSALLTRIVAAGKGRDQAALPWLLEQLQGDDEGQVLAACTALGRIRDLRAEGPLRQLLADPRPQVQQHAVEALGALGQSLETALALEILQASQEGQLGRAAGEALARVRHRARAAARGGLVAARPGKRSR